MYEQLIEEAYYNGVDIYKMPMKKRIKGLYGDNVIWINENIDTTVEKTCVLAEELGHHHTSAGDILNQSKISNRKQERRARVWAAERILALDKFIGAFENGCSSRFEIAEFCGVTESFLEQSLKFYREKYGSDVQVDEQHVLFLDPLAVLKLF